MMNVPNPVGRTIVLLVALAAVHVAVTPLRAQDLPQTNHPPSDGRDGITATFSIVATIEAVSPLVSASQNRD
ncbi:MAG: hypothetical protein ACKO38_08670 [Planctomycetota bacterium]